MTYNQSHPSRLHREQERLSLKAEKCSASQLPITLPRDLRSLNTRTTTPLCRDCPDVLFPSRKGGPYGDLSGLRSCKGLSLSQPYSDKKLLEPTSSFSTSLPYVRFFEDALYNESIASPDSGFGSDDLEGAKSEKDFAKMNASRRGTFGKIFEI